LPAHDNGIAFPLAANYHLITIIMRFNNPHMERRALGFLAGRISFKTRDTNETAVPSQALGSLATKGSEGHAAVVHRLRGRASNPAAPSVATVSELSTAVGSQGEEGLNGS